MKKRKTLNKMAELERQNPVAKFAHQFNTAKIFDDKSKYSRKLKHAKQEASSSVLV